MLGDDVVCLQGQTFTLVMVDPDAPNRTQEQYYLHWIRANIPVRPLQYAIYQPDSDISTLLYIPFCVFKYLSCLNIVFASCFALQFLFFVVYVKIINQNHNDFDNRFQGEDFRTGTLENSQEIACKFVITVHRRMLINSRFPPGGAHMLLRILNDF